MSNSEDNKKIYRNIDTAIYFAGGVTIVGLSTAFTLASFGVSSPITLYTTAVGLGLVGGLGATLIPVKLTKYVGDEDKPLPSPTQAIFGIFSGFSQDKGKPI